MTFEFYSRKDQWVRGVLPHRASDLSSLKLTYHLSRSWMLPSMVRSIILALVYFFPYSWLLQSITLYGYLFLLLKQICDLCVIIIFPPILLCQRERSIRSWGVECTLYSCEGEFNHFNFIYLFCPLPPPLEVSCHLRKGGEYGFMCLQV